MIISRTPLRVSFFGGGTDLPSFYRKSFGQVLSTTINKYVYVTVNKILDDKIRVVYSKVEIVDDVKDIQHEIVRECLIERNVLDHIEVSIHSDVPKGTGLGSSSSLTVGLLNALKRFKGKGDWSKADLAKKACEIEIEKVGSPIGKQDQYAAAFGGFNYMRFKPNDSVEVVRGGIITSEVSYQLEKNLMLFYTKQTRDANVILAKQSMLSGSDDKGMVLETMGDMASKPLPSLENIDSFGKDLHKAWMFKKTLVDEISNQLIDSAYSKALNAGAIGGKIVGAGGGGFLLIYSPEQNQNKVRKTLSNLQEVPFRFTYKGSEVVFDDSERIC